MNKTRKIEGYIYKNHEPWIEEGCGIPFHTEINPEGGPIIKAKLIIEIPEKKVTITESELEEAFKGARKQYRDVSDQLWHMKKILFGEEK